MHMQQQSDSESEAEMSQFMSSVARRSRILDQQQQPLQSGFQPVQVMPLTGGPSVLTQQHQLHTMPLSPAISHASRLSATVPSMMMQQPQQHPQNQIPFQQQQQSMAYNQPQQLAMPTPMPVANVQTPMMAVTPAAAQQLPPQQQQVQKQMMQQPQPNFVHHQQQPQMPIQQLIPQYGQQQLNYDQLQQQQHLQNQDHLIQQQQQVDWCVTSVRIWPHHPRKTHFLCQASIKSD